ncbi:TetR/AcrR family transcriptional regulator [Pseudomonas hefeiensis]|uniref:TetR/AcrR family transcriptional regulator n=1 Tax=Pseudomonas hefeiensis TaxID=2738125 RepID=A0ABY9GH18_9PSED|nr:MULTISPECIES: TetR/AcrR family transcriptional regulator [unclassified Pseudomonas]WLH14769.1 TetR/AcrR family transcriptional regulator [Pseudomonas sp. FP205]WLH97822.1 TetR/AcrR family transcriptional regulator [Pseudomonas sp. FP53]WLI42095.1 TetR/AcrR family transcriptional regulator [Pseudomonas sp. FP821]
MTGTTRKRTRRKEARPAEIIAAAMSVFAENGFAAAKLGDIAQRAGIVKGTLYLYFDTKEELFRAVVQEAIIGSLQIIESTAVRFSGSMREIVPILLKETAEHMESSSLPALARLVISESQAFPDIVKIWYDNVVVRVIGLFTVLISEAQARGEVRPGDPVIHAFSILGPLISGSLFCDVFGVSASYAPNLVALASQHAETVLEGLLV